jgi:hypothetical protein
MPRPISSRPAGIAFREAAITPSVCVTEATVAGEADSAATV